MEDLKTNLKNTMAQWASGVSVVTTRREGLVYGITVSSFTSVAMEPPLIAVCLNRENRLAEMVELSGRFAVSLLAAGQQDVSNYFASSGREPTETFTEVATDNYQGLPVVTDALGHLICQVHEVIDLGTHAFVVGRVQHTRSHEDSGALLYWRRGYREV